MVDLVQLEQQVFPSKPLGGYGDGGACFTNDEDLATRIRQISLHGQSKRYYHQNIGINGRLDTIQAAIILEKLELFNQEVKAREIIGTDILPNLIDLVSMALHLFPLTIQVFMDNIQFRSMIESRSSKS